MSRATRIGIIAALLSVFILVHSIRDQLGIGLDPESVRQFVLSLGWWGPISFVLLFAFRSVLLLPSVVLLTAGGICFGVLGGAIFGALGLTFSAFLKFLIGHLAQRDRLLEKLPRKTRERLARFNHPTSAGALALATAYPVGPAEILHIAAILAGIGAFPFFLSVGTGALVRASSFSLFGDSLVHGRGLLVAVITISALAVLPLAFSPVRAILFRTET